jgi:hypothetical protein
VTKGIGKGPHHHLNGAPHGPGSLTWRGPFPPFFLLIHILIPLFATQDDTLIHDAWMAELVQIQFNVGAPTHIRNCLVSPEWRLATWIAMSSSQYAASALRGPPAQKAARNWWCRNCLRRGPLAFLWQGHHTIHITGHNKNAFEQGSFISFLYTFRRSEEYFIPTNEFGMCSI